VSFIITITTREGLVMAADSRLSLSFPNPDFKDPANSGATQLISVTQSDAAQKLFAAADRIGISTCGGADINGVPLAGFIESFTLRLAEENLAIKSAAQSLLEHFIKIAPRLFTYFHVAGYSPGEELPELWFVDVHEKKISQLIKPGEQAARWNGEYDIINRLLTPVHTKDAKGAYVAYPQHGIAFNFFTLQDAIDLAVHAVRTTIDTMRFQGRVRTVGGPIDVLIIRPGGVKWLRKKDLYYPHE
jgi:hypothetical protein